MASNLYEEAIAEAKQLREVAEKNAKNAIVEAVTPKIRQFIEAQLVGDTSSGDDSDVLESTVNDMLSEHSGTQSEDDVILTNDALSTLMELFGDSDDMSEPLRKLKSRSLALGAMQEALDTMDSEEKKKLLNVVDKLRLNANSLSTSDIVMQESFSFNDVEENINMSQDTLYEVDLDALMESLDLSEEETPETPAGEQPQEETEHGPLDELDLILKGLPDELRDQLDLSQLAIEFGEEEEEGEEVDLEDEEDLEEPEGEEGEELEEPEGEELPDLDELFEVDVSMLRSELGRLSEAAKDLSKIKGIKNDMAHHWGGKGHGNAGVKGSYGGTGGSKGDDFGGGKRTKDPLQVKVNVLSEAYTNERRKNRSLKKRLNEYVGAVDSLREQLTEMNLFNAKLLYVNKLLQNKDMGASQRRSIIEALDGATSLREAKLLYRSLTESLAKPRKGRLSESALRRTLGSSSRTVGASSPRNEQVAEVDRWATLAGIQSDN